MASWTTMFTKDGWVSRCDIGDCGFKTEAFTYAASAEVRMNHHRQTVKHPKAAAQEAK